MELFDRQCRLGIGRNGGIGFEVGAVQGTGIPIHIKFDIEKADCESPNTAKISVWNLSPEHLAELDKKDCCVVLRAGYGSNLSLIFTGTVTSSSTTLEGADSMTEIEAADGRTELRDSHLSVSYAAGTSTDTIYRDISSKMGAPITLSTGASTAGKSMGNGFSFVGSTKDMLKRLTSYDGSNWTMQDGVIQVTRPGEPISQRCFELNAGSGLLGIPKKVNSSATASDQESATVTDSATAQTGYEITYLMNVAIGVNSYVHITSRTMTGYFRVQKVAISGDNVEGDWQCTATVVEVKCQ